MKLTTAQKLNELAEDYKHLAQDDNGKLDAMRQRNYLWLLALSVQLRDLDAKVRGKKRQK